MVVTFLLLTDFPLNYEVHYIVERKFNFIIVVEEQGDLQLKVMNKVQEVYQQVVAVLLLLELNVHRWKLSQVGLQNRKNLDWLALLFAQRLRENQTLEGSERQKHLGLPLHSDLDFFFLPFAEDQEIEVVEGLDDFLVAFGESDYFFPDGRVSF